MVCEKTLDLGASIGRQDTPQACLEVIDDAWRGDDEVAGDQRLAHAARPALALEPHAGGYDSAWAGVGGFVDVCSARAIDLADEVIRADLVGTELGSKVFLLGRRDAWPELEAQALVQSVEKGGVNRRDRRRPDQQLLERHHSLLGPVEVALGELRRRDIEAGNHARRVHVYKNRALIDQAVAVEKAAGAAELAPTNLDVVARTESGADAESNGEASRDCTADCCADVCERFARQAAAREHQLPGDLALIQVDRAAAGDAPHESDVVGAHIVELHLAAQRLMAADEHSRPEAEESHGIR